MTVELDGRRARGARTRKQLLEATLRVVELQGVAGVTHRSVTREAGLPATSAAYHFPSIDQLLEAALLWADEQNCQALADISQADDPVAALARWLVDDLGADPSRCIAEYELFLHAARRPALRRAATRWLVDLHALVRRWTPTDDRAAMVCAYVDGMLIHALVSGSTPSPAQVEAAIRDML
jgi:DNA-binding transcriptional regulator YbjK